MKAEAPKPRWLKFESFTADLQTGDLRKGDRVVKLQPQPFKLLVLLASRSGEVIDREEIQKELWGNDTVVDFEHGINFSIKAIRTALGEDAGKPRYIQTIPRRGYRFIAPVQSEKPAPEKTSWRKAAVAASLGLLLLAGVSLFWMLRSRPVEPVSPTRIAILPFTVNGSEEFAYLREGLAELFGHTLETETHRTVDSRTLLRYATHRSDGTYDPESGAEVAEHFGAGRFLLGTLVETAGRIRVQATIHDTAGEKEVIAEAVVEGSGEELLALVDQLSGQLMLASEEGNISQLTQAAAETTPSLAAFKAFLEGEKALRAGSVDMEKASEAYLRAVELDPEFALAWYRLAFIEGWDWDKGPPFTDYIGKALAFSHRLSERDHMRVQWLNSIDTNFDESVMILEKLLQHYPDDSEAWAALGQQYYFFDNLRGRLRKESLRNAETCMDKGFSLDPGFFDNIFTLRGVAVALGKFDKAERLTRAYYGEKTPPLFWRTITAMANGTAKERALVLEELREAPFPIVAVTTNKYLALREGGYTNAKACFQLLTEPERPKEERAIAHGILSEILAMGEGRLKEAHYELQKAEICYPVAGLIRRATLAMRLFLPKREEELIAARDHVLSWDAQGTRPDRNLPLRHLLKSKGGFVHQDQEATGDALAVSFSYSEGFLPIVRVYLLGLLNARLGENRKALEFAAELESLPEPKSSPRFPVDWHQMTADMVRTIHAFAAHNDGRKQEALALLEQQVAYPRVTSRFFLQNGFLIMNPVPPRAFIIDTPIDLKAQILEELGRYDEALGWYSWKWGLTYLRSGRIYEKLGNPEKAIEKYSRFVADWKDCDPELRHFVEEAEARLELLRGEGTT